ncbi:MAG: Co2+/Mg2+ efflux protein ApaG [Pseudomonadota bacterium]
MDVQSTIYQRETNGIHVTVEPAFLEDQSDPEASHFVWAYTVRIANQTEKPVRLRARHWQITDEVGRTEEVMGEGVVGEQPLIEPGTQFEYTSGAPLSTPSGFMVGTYHMEAVNGDLFDVAIPAFSLDSPHEQRRVH